MNPFARRASIAALTLVVPWPAHAMPAASPDVVAVYPSGATVPERLLRISMRFDVSPKDRVIEHVTLRRADNSIIEGAFLQEELWSPDRKTITMLLDPGRVKSGLVANEELGRALVADTSVTIFVGDVRVRTWQVIAGGCAVPDPSSWQIKPPASWSRKTLTVTLSSPIDAQSLALIAVADDHDQRIEGQAFLDTGELAWTFVPAKPWPRGVFRLVIHPRLENPCGDQIGEGFEHLAGQGLGSIRRAQSLQFAIE